MKNLFLLFCFTALLFSCKKAPDPLQGDGAHWGTMAVQKNGNTWTAAPFAAIYSDIPNTIAIEFDSLDVSGTIREVCLISKVPLIPGTYPVENTVLNSDNSKLGSDFQYREGDWGYGKYEILKSDHSSFLTLLSYDAATKEITGSFDLTFIATHKPYPSAPDTLRLRNGVFHTKILK